MKRVLFAAGLAAISGGMALMSASAQAATSAENRRAGCGGHSVSLRSLNRVAA